jgi:hypothetical protein
MSALIPTTNVCIACHLLYNYFFFTFQVWISVICATSGLANLKLLLKLSAFLKVWEVQIWRIDPSTSERKDLVSTARVTLLANLSTPQVMKNYEEGLKKFSSKL